MSGISQYDFNSAEDYNDAGALLKGRACGFIFTTAFVRKLTKVGATNKSLGDDDEDFTENQEETYAEFTKTVHEYLVSREEAKAKGKQIISTSGSGPSEATSNALGKRKTSGLYGGTNQGLVSMVSMLGAEYLNSYQGFDDVSDHGALHNTLRKIQAGQETDIDVVEWAHRALDYRMSLMSVADKYLQMMGIAAPKGQLCCEYDIYNVRKEVGEVKYSTINRLILDREILFPRPIEGQGRPFPKGEQYLVAAFHHAQIPKDIVVEKLDALVATLDQALEEEKEMLKRDAEVRSKRRRLFQAFGVALENMSPSKRLSRGLSLTGSA